VATKVLEVANKPFEMTSKTTEDGSHLGSHRLIETGPLDQAAAHCAGMMQGKARFRMVLVAKEVVANSVPFH
jgi:hypothetical protein